MMIVAITTSWATQTNLISGVTLPDVPASSLDLSSQTTFTADDNGWIVMVATEAIPSTTPTWAAINGSRGTQSPQSTFTASDPSTTTAPFVTCSSGLKINKYSPDVAIRFTGAEKASFLVSARSTSTNKEMDIALFTYNSATGAQTQVGDTKTTTSKDPQELIFNDLETSNIYVAYIYGGSGGQNGSLMEIALKAPTKTISTQEFAGVKKGATTVTANTDYTVDGTTITMSEDYAETTAPTDIKLINHITYTDESTTDKDVAVTLEENAAGTYFEGTATIGSTTYTVKVPVYIPTSAPTITTDLEAAYNVQKGQTQELSIVAENASSYQWYLDGEAIDGATSASYTYTAGSTIGATNEIYCEAINSAGSTNSTIATMTVTGSNACELTNIKFSNGAYGAIGSATYGAGTIAVPYIEGDEAPTVETSSVAVSDGATFSIDGNTFTVTAEDGTTTKEFTITPVEMTPLEVSADIATTSFTDVPSWVFNLYGYDSSKGLKFAKAVDDASNMRIALGNTRQYYFIGAAKSLTLTYTGTARKVNVYVNGTQVITNTNNSELGAIELDESAPCMVMVEAGAGTTGDGGFASYAIEAVPVPTTETITIPDDGVLTYVTENDLDFSTIDGDITAYAVTAVSATSATTAVVAQVPAGTALLIKGTAGSYDIEIAESASAITNLLLASDGTITGGDNIYAYSKTAKKFKKVASTVTIPAGKAYLQANAGDAIDIDFAGEATAVEAIAEAAEAVAPVKVVTAKGIQIGKYNIAGQQVK